MTSTTGAIALDYWDAFYADRRSTGVPSEPSAFARWVDTGLTSPARVVELGFGTGRDALWFVAQGHEVTGLDGSHSAVARAEAHIDEHGLKASVGQLDLTDDEAVAAAARAIVASGGADVVYGRFLLHSLPEEGRLNVLRLAAQALREKGSLFLEFRTGKDAGAPHLFGDDHFRVYLEPEDVARQIRQLGGSITHLEQGHGLAVYKSEDPHVARIVAHWTRSA